MPRRSGVLKYTERAFSQDAEEAMRGDLIRGLVELITNADDAYSARGGVIDIILEKGDSTFPFIISVCDKAGGLNADGMEKAFTQLGDQNQKFVDDQGTRGLFGRGAKDVAIFGKVIFASIKECKYSELQIDATSKYSMEFEDEAPSGQAHAFTRLSPGESGLTARLCVHSRFKIPSPLEMIEKLQNHSQLRDLMNRNIVHFTDARSGEIVQLKGLEPSGELILDQYLDIPSYGQKAHLTLYKLPSKENSGLSEYSRHGLLITGKGAAYENSFLALSGRPEASWFCGRLDAPEIHDLARAIDQEGGKTDQNPTRIVSRSRDGLVKDHKYYRALSGALDKAIKPFFEQVALQEGAQRKEGAELRSRFDSVAHALAKTIQEVLDASELDDFPDVTSTDLLGQQDFEIIPPRRLAKVGESFTLTVRAPLDLEKELSLVTINQAQDVISNDSTKLEVRGWRQHPTLPANDGTLRFTAKNLGSSTIVVTIGNRSAKAEINVIEPEDEVIDLPTDLKFEEPQYSVSPGKVRKVLIQAPINFSGERPEVGSSELGIEIARPSVFKPHSSGLYVETAVFIKAPPMELTASISADCLGSTAETTLRVQQPGNRRQPNVTINLDGRDNPPRRADTLMEAGKLVIKIYGHHRSMTQVFGKHNGEAFSNENSKEASATIVEVVSQQLASYLVEREAEGHPARFTDAAKYFIRQQQLIAQLLIPLQAGLLVE